MLFCQFSVPIYLLNFTRFAQTKIEFGHSNPHMAQQNIDTADDHSRF